MSMWKLQAANRRYCWRNTLQGRMKSQSNEDLFRSPVVYIYHSSTHAYERRKAVMIFLFIDTSESLRITFWLSRRTLQQHILRQSNLIVYGKRMWRKQKSWTESKWKRNKPFRWSRLARIWWGTRFIYERDEKRKKMKGGRARTRMSQRLRVSWENLAETSSWSVKLCRIAVHFVWEIDWYTRFVFEWVWCRVFIDVISGLKWALRIWLHSLLAEWERWR